jgi:lipopolysaccharide export LptBFGC system permease protein LptF
MIHDLNALPCFAAVTATILVLAARFAGQPARRGRMWGSVAIGLVVPATFVLGGVLFSQAAAAGTLAASYHGLAQRSPSPSASAG